jgi:hypothetical protein
MMFPEHGRWLIDNEMEYQVQGFRWPEMLTPRSAQMMVFFEFDVIFEDVPQAIMFLFFSGKRVLDES